jgi:hypothetical protein
MVFWQGKVPFNGINLSVVNDITPSLAPKADKLSPKWRGELGL